MTTTSSSALGLGAALTVLAMTGCSSGSVATAQPVSPTTASVSVSATASASGASTSGSSATTSGGPPGTATPPSGSASSSSSSTGPAATGSGSASGSSAGSRCHTSQLTAREGGGNGAGGRTDTVIVLTNRSGSSCTLHGYPGLQLVDAHRRFIPTHVYRGKVSMQPEATPRTVTLAPGARASFVLEYTDNPGPSDPPRCNPSTFAEITPPDERDYLFVPLVVGACQGGGIGVTAVLAGVARA